MSAVTEETLSVSGILLGKTFAAQERSIERFRGLNTELARLQIRQAMVGRWFFMIIGTIFSIMPAFVYWLAGTMAANGSPERADGRRHRRVHDAPEPAVLPARPAAQRPGRDPGLARAVRPDLRVPGPRSRDHGRARRGRAGARRRSVGPWRSRACRSVPGRAGGALADGGDAAAARRRSRRTRQLDRGRAGEAERRIDGGARPTPRPRFDGRRWRARRRPPPVAVRARGRLVRGAARASWSRWSARRAPARPRPRT